MTDRGRSAPRLRPGAILTVAILAVIIALAALAQTAPGRHLAADLGIRTSSEAFTDLYFEHPGYVGLPIDNTASGPVRDKVSFGIRNQEDRGVDYSWSIRFSRDGHRYSGTVHVTSGHTATVAQKVTVPCGAGHAVRLTSRPVKVTVSLQWPNDSIYFWQQCNG